MFASPGGAAVNTRHRYALPSRLRLNQWALFGEWTVRAEAAVLNAAGGRIAFRFHARDLHLITGPSDRRGAVPFRVLIDGQPPGANRGSDVDDQGEGTVVEQRLYQLVRQSGPIADRQCEISSSILAWKRSPSRSAEGVARLADALSNLRRRRNGIKPRLSRAHGGWASAGRRLTARNLGEPSQFHATYAASRINQLRKSSSAG
jgi:hypothetical protein